MNLIYWMTEHPISVMSEVTYIVPNLREDCCGEKEIRIKTMKENYSLPEPILQENPNRFVIFPIEHQDIWEMYKNQEACIWTAEEIDLSADINDWRNNLNDNERPVS